MATLLYFVKLALTGLSPAKLVERARAIIAALTGNAAYTTPVPSLADVGAAADAVEAADTAVLNNGGKQDYLARRERVQELRDLLTLLGSYVQVTSGGDPEKILSAGYAYRKTAEPVGIMGIPGNLRVEASTLPGVLDLRWDSVYGRLFYEAQWTDGDPQAPGAFKALASQGSNTFTMTDLISNHAYTFRVRAVGAAGPGPWSDIATQKPR